jgi:predicted alpha/beta-fold hydrolase
METRNHGQSIAHWTSIGWKEGQDILAAAKWLKGTKDGDEVIQEQPSIAVIGFSLGAWYGIRAAYDASVTSQEYLLNGGVIAFNPPVNIKEAVLDWNQDEYRGSEFTLRSQVFKQFDSYLRKRIEELGKEAEFKAVGGTFDAYIELAANDQKLNREELYQRAVLSPEQIAEKVRVPVVVYHAADDPVVNVKHAQNLKRAIEINDSRYMKVIIKEKGGHIALHEVEPNYYVNLILTVLDGLKR